MLECKKNIVEESGFTDYCEPYVARKIASNINSPMQLNERTQLGCHRLSLGHERVIAVESLNDCTARCETFKRLH
jgi:hypothetical protein